MKRHILSADGKVDMQRGPRNGLWTQRAHRDLVFGGNDACDVPQHLSSGWDWCLTAASSLTSNPLSFPAAEANSCSELDWSVGAEPKQGLELLLLCAEQRRVNPLSKI